MVNFNAMPWVLVASFRWWGGLCEERPGLPHARHSHFQLAPTDPPEGMTEPLSQDGGASGKKCLRKFKTSCSSVRSEENQ